MSGTQAALLGLHSEGKEVLTARHFRKLLVKPLVSLARSTRHLQQLFHSWVSLAGHGSCTPALSLP